MNKSSIYTIVPYLIFLIIFTGCDFTPTGTNYKTVKPPQADVTFTVLLPDTVNPLRGEVTIDFQADLNGHRLFEINAYLDSAEIQFHQDNQNQLSFYSNDYPDGDYILTLELITSSNSGSFADHFGHEIITTSHQYPVTIFNSDFNTPQITGFSIENGSLTIHWEKFIQPFFKEYDLIKGWSVIASIQDADQTSFSDTSYFTGSERYLLTTHAQQEELTSDQKTYEYYSVSFVSSSLLPGDKLLLVWNKYPFTSSFGKYRIIGPMGISEITSADDTSLIYDNPPLGTGGRYKLSAFSKSGEKTPIDAQIDGQPVGIPFEFGLSDWMRYFPAKNLYYKIWYSDAVAKRSIAKYDGNLNLIQSQYTDFNCGKVGWGISDNGENIYYTYARKVYRIDPVTLMKIDETDLLNLMPPGSYAPNNPVYSIKVNNNNILAAIIVNQNSTQLLAFFNMDTKQLINSFQLNYGNFADNLKISDDLQRIIFGEKIYAYNGFSLNAIGSILSYSSEFTPDYSSIIISYPDRIQILQSSDLHVILEIPGTFSDGPSVDSKTGYFGIDGNIFDPSSGQKLGWIKIYGDNKFYLNGNYFVDGYYKYVELN